jgi:outer membrane receptor protein involved in Fe transport
MLKRIALTTTAVIGLTAGYTAAPTPAKAQTETAQRPAAIEEIVVTARKREETLQSVPLSVAAFTSDAIEDRSLRNLSEIAQLTPGLSFNQDFGRRSDRPIIRGQANILGDSGVAYFVDGVYITGSILTYDLNDVERVEVIKGPQSALYGRNTYSGAINIITKRPGDELSGRVSAELATHGQWEVSGSVKSPIIPGKLSGGVNLRAYKFGGEHTNAFSGDKDDTERTYSGSAVLVATPTEWINWTVRAAKSADKDGPAATFLQPASQNNCFFDNSALYAGGGRYFCGTVEPRNINRDDIRQVQNVESGFDRQTKAISSKLEIEPVENFKFTSITGFNKFDERFAQDADHTVGAFQAYITNPAPVPGAGGVTTFTILQTDLTFDERRDRKDWSQEVRLSYEGERLRGIVGAYYYRDNNQLQSQRVFNAAQLQLISDNLNAARARATALCATIAGCRVPVPVQIASPNPPSRNYSELLTINKAIFAQIGYDVTDALSVSVEARGAKETQRQKSVVQNTANQGTVPFTYLRGEFKSFSPRFTVDYKLTDQNLLYAVVARGTKPGGLNGAEAVAAGSPTFEEERVWSYEAGSKNTFLDGQLQANAAFFYNKVKGYQLTSAIPTRTATTSITANVGDATIKGVELGLTAAPQFIEGLVASVNYAYTHSKFTKGVDQDWGLLLDLADDRLANCSTGDQFPTVAGCQSLYGSIVGKRIPRQPQHQLSLSLTYTQPLFDTWDWYIGGDVAYESAKYDQVSNLASFGESTIVGLRAGVENEQYAVRLWAKNLFDEDSPATVVRYVDGNDSQKRAFFGVLRRGQQFGITASAKF